MQALVIGAGVGGPVAAMALQRAGLEAVVYEAQPRPADRGSYLTVASNGLDALRAIDAHQPVLTAGFPTPWSELASGAGRVLGRVPISSSQPGRDPSLTFHRSTLHHALQQEARRRGIPIEFGKRLVAVDEEGSSVTARFEDGTEARGDVLVGCDGVHSRVRSIIAPDSPSPRYLGLLNFGGYTKGAAMGEPGVWHMIFGARAFFGYVRDPRGGTAWFANVPRHAASRAEREATTGAAWTEWLRAQFASDAGPAATLIESGELELAADNTHDLPVLPIWHSARAIVIGDAAHAPSPSSGQGASMAIEDGVILAAHLRDHATVPAALAAFERARRRRVERIVAHGARSGASKAAGPIGRMLRDRMLPFVFRYVVTARSLAWIYDHHVEWDHHVGRAADVA